MDVMQVVDFVVDNSVTIVAIIGGVVTVATAVARLTPTEKDNKFIERYVRKPLEFIANVGLPNLVKARKGRKTKIVIEK